MKRLSMLVMTTLASAALAAAQGAMMQSSPAASGQGTGSMMSPNAGSPANTMMATSQESGYMADKNYQALKARGLLADTAVGMRLRDETGTGGKVPYTDLMAAQKLAAKGPTLLFFAADWCPNCQADLRDINSNGARLEGATVVVVNYDKASDLKTKYGISAQDSYVQIDAKGAAIATWNGGGAGVDGILQHLKRGMM